MIAPICPNLNYEMQALNVHFCENERVLFLSEAFCVSTGYVG